jgi:hypothetical protein
MKPLFTLVMAFMSATVIAQSPAAIHDSASIDDTTLYNVVQAQEKYWAQYFDKLGEMGVEIKNDSLVVRPEVIMLFTDSAYRKAAYPDQYSWQEAIMLMQKMELKLAFWHLLNLYDTDTAHRSLVLGTFVAYDSLMSMDKILLSTFYTYAFADPRIARLVNNKPDIFRPDLLERGLARLKDIIMQVWFYRQQRVSKR